MRIAESVTFGGAGLDRAAHLRGDSARLEALRGDPRCRRLGFWRGKPLVAGEALASLPRDRDVFPDVAVEVFLGLAGGAPVFAADVSAWEPDDLPQTLGAFHDPSEQRHPDLPEDHRFAELRRLMVRLTAADAELAASARALIEWHRTHRFCARCGHESAPAQGGWQRECPACGAHHFPRIDPVVIMLVLHKNSVLLGRSPGWPEGFYSLLAGFVEPGETLEAAVRRETFEEAGVRVARVDYLASQPWPFPASLMVGCRAEATTQEIRVDPAELEDARWLTREEVMDAFAGRHRDVKPARDGAIARFLLRNWLADRLD